MADLVVNLTETIQLNNEIESNITNLKISGINYIDNRNMICLYGALLNDLNALSSSITTNVSGTAAIYNNISSSISGTIGNTYYVIINGNTGFFSGGINATGSLIFPANLTLPLGISSASISNGAVMFYPI
jgi:hypothetical protein